MSSETTVDTPENNQGDNVVSLFGTEAPHTQEPKSWLGRAFHSASKAKETFGAVTDQALQGKWGQRLLALGITIPFASTVRPRFFDGAESLISHYPTAVVTGDLATLGLSYCVFKIARHGIPPFFGIEHK